MEETKYIPNWEGPIEWHVKNQANKQGWRVASLGYGFQDLMQESYLVYLRCAKKYYYVDNPKHFMRLFSISLKNFYITLSKKTRKANLAKTNLEEKIKNNELLGLEQEEATLKVAIYFAPDDIKCFLIKLVTASEEELEFVRKNRRGFGNKKVIAYLFRDEEEYQGKNFKKILAEYFLL